MAQLTIKHNGFLIKLAQKGQNFLYEIRENGTLTRGGSVYAGDGDKLGSIGKRVKEIKGL
jgi:hypothetical protein